MTPVDSGDRQLLGTLNAITERFATVRDLGTLARLVEREIEAIVQVDYSGFYFYDEAGGRMELLWARGFSEEERRVAEETALERHPGWVVRNRRVLDIPDTEDNGRSVTSPRAFEIRSRLYFPVVFQDRCFGAVGLGSDRPHAFSDAHRMMLSFVCNVAAIAYQNVLHAEREKELSERRYRKLIESANDGILLTGPGSELVYANTLFRETLGHTPEELRGMRLVELGAGQSRQQLDEVFQKATEGVESRNVEVSLLRVEGDPLDFELNMVPLFRDGAFEGGFAVVRDISGRKRVQVQLARADRLASLGVLAAGVGHEINNPLTFLSANLHFMRQELADLESSLQNLEQRLAARLDPDEARQILREAGVAGEPSRLPELTGMLDEAGEGAERVRRIVVDLKAFSRPDSDVREPVQINDVVRSALAMARNEIRFRARVRRELGQVPEVLADAGRLSQVLLNLLINAAHAIEEGQVEDNLITVRTRAADGEVVVEVRDTGEGIPAEDLDRIFDPFYTSKPEGLGSGLGLPISHSIVTSLGGRMEVESVVGRGSTFRVHLPLAGEHAGADPGRREEGEVGCAAARGRVLVVDDEPTICTVLRRMLRGHEVVTAGSGAEALQVLKQDQGFDVILCDLMMPDVSGMALFRRVSARDPDLARRMVFMTGGACTPRARAFLEEASRAVLHKPFSLEQVRSLVEAALDQRYSRKGRSAPR